MMKVTVNVTVKYHSFFFSVDFPLFALSINLLLKANIICKWSQIVQYKMTEHIYSWEWGMEYY